MRAARLALAAVVAAVFLAGCGPLGGEEETQLRPLDPTVVDRVVEDVLSRMTLHHEEAGPQFVTRLPELKDAAAAHAGFEDWLAFKARLNRTAPDLEVRVARRITEKIRSLLGL